MRDRLPGADGAQEAPVHARRVQAGAHVAHVAVDLGLAGVGQRPGAHRQGHADLLLPLARLALGGHTGVGVAVGVGEQHPVAALGEGGELDRALGRGGGHVGHVRPQPQPTQALEGVAPPRPVVDACAHGVAVLTVVGDVDPDLGLAAHDLDRRLAQALLVGALVVGLAVEPPAVELDQVVGPGQAARVAGQDPIAALTHVVPLLAAAGPPAAHRWTWRSYASAHAAGWWCAAHGRA